MERSKGWYIKQSYPNDFVDFMTELYKKYGESVFEIQGIANRHMDLVQFSRNFFEKSSNVADLSVDSNANVKEKNISQYNYENNKALMKLNSLYLLYKYVKKIFSLEDAQEVLEKVISGEIFINDLTNFSMPYSYYQETPIIVKINGKIKYLTMKQLFNLFSEHKEILNDRETIDLTNIYKDVSLNQVGFKLNGRKLKTFKQDVFLQNVEEKQNIKILDQNMQWVSLTAVLRHKNDRGLIFYQTENGNFSLVTDNHPIISENGTQIVAHNLNIGDRIKEEKLNFKFKESINVPEDLAYIVGFLLGDGSISRHKFYNSKFEKDDTCINISRQSNKISIYQKNIEETKIFCKLKKFFPKLRFNIRRNRDMLYFSSLKLNLLLKEYFDLNEIDNSFLKKLPSNILNWKKESKVALISGLIDSDGTTNHSRIVDIRMKAYALITQLSEVLTSIGIESHKRLCNNKNFNFLFGISFNPTIDFANYSEKVKHKITNFNIKTKMASILRSNKVCKIFKIDSKSKINNYGNNVLEYVYDITTETNTFYSGGMIQHNCYAFDLRNLITKGMDFFSGNMNISAPKRSDSFIALIIQTTAYISNQIMGAASYPDFFVVLDWYYRKEFSEDYSTIMRIGKNNKDSEEYKVWERIKNQFQNFIYSMNFPFRGSQSAFTNISVMDSGFMKSLFGDYIYPDFTRPNIDSVLNLSKLFFEYYTDINSVEGMFTFPIMTIAISVDKDRNYIDPEFVDWAAEINSKKALANIFQDKPTSFSSCCRLKNDFSKVADAGYHNSFGVGGLSIGSHRVAGLNLPRLAILERDDSDIIEKDLEILHKILYSHRRLITDRIEGGFLPLYTTDWIRLSRQYSTIGFIGGYEYIKNRGLDIKTNKGQKVLLNVLQKIENKIVMWQEEEKEEKNIYNIEQIPGESMAVRLADLDQILGYNLKARNHIDEEIDVPYLDRERKFELYSNQYIPLIENVSIYDRFVIQGKFDSLTSGGAILHINVDDEKPISAEQFKRLIISAKSLNVVYFAINYAYSECKARHFVIGKKDQCSICGANIVQQYTRVVGFITPVNSWNSTRRDIEYSSRVFYKNGSLEIQGEINGTDSISH